MNETKDLSLKSLEVFQTCARCGSISAAAKAMNVSTSTIAHHLKNIENYIGVGILDRSRKPLGLTIAGESFLADIEPALASLRQAQANANPDKMQFGRQFRFGAIEDFEIEIVPDLAVFLNGQLPNMNFTYQIETSLTLLNMLHDRELDMGFMAKPQTHIQGLRFQAILRDPFVLVVPNNCRYTAEDFLTGETDIPYLRFHSSQMIAQQIESHLQRMKVTLPKRIGLGNNAILMALVAADAGWAITTPLLYARGKRYHNDVRLLSLPKQQFSREVGLFSSNDCSEQMFELVHAKLQKLIQVHALKPVHDAYPWLQNIFHAVDH